MSMYDIIQKKRDGGVLTTDEIRFFVKGYTDGTIPDYQASALCMAIYFRGMTQTETLALTLAIRDSGKILDFSSIRGVRADKHSTGGVGDKTTLAVAPIVASLGIKVAKLSGRGLGHTGGTIDKLESFPGLQTELSMEEFADIVNNVGVAVIGQSADVAPADKLLYGLRDVTATVDSIPLIASSIMGKKLAADDDCIVLDVKTGSGAFMKSHEDSLTLARTMLEIGKGAGKKIIALVTDMNRPLGHAIGNSLEVCEAIDVLRGCAPDDITELCVALSSHMLALAGYGEYKRCEQAVLNTIKSGAALDLLARMVKAQHGNADAVYDTSLLPKAKLCGEAVAARDGYIYEVDTEGYGTASRLLGAGRLVKGDTIDLSAGIMLQKTRGDRVKKGEVIALLYSSDEAKLEAGRQKLIESTVIADTKPTVNPLIYDVLE